MVIDTYQGRILHSAETDEDLKGDTRINFG